ncbi:MAG TPA: alternative ribosome rescue aminoacyl-tRNA hydrolase ArfB [Acidimicrobiia bacterium]|nr:alternative ribosome rescue aminoacyl-tRNA hydrolase ArfB [Acidimicrobiia bacterium]
MRFDIPDSELQWRFGPSGGPGGQHANKAATRAELTFDVAASSAFEGDVRDRLVSRLGQAVRIVEDGSRSQVANRREALRRLHAVLEDAARPPPRPRRATRPSRSARLRRLESKRARGRTKEQRRSPRNHDDP